MPDPRKSVRAHIRQLEAYHPILPFEVLSERLGKPPEEIVKLDANENPYGPLPAVREALAHLPFPHIYPDPECRTLRRALAAYLDMPADNLLAGAGADELIDLVMRLTLDPGDVMLNCPPTFGMYAFDAGVNHARRVDIRRGPDFSLDLTAIQQAVQAYAPKLLFLASPNNPDGALLPEPAFERLVSLPLILVLDEAYVDFAPPGSSRIHRVLEHDNLVVLRTFSKYAGLAGLRLGYGAFPRWMAAQLWKIKQPYDVSVSASAAAIASLEHLEELEAVKSKILAERDRLHSALSAVNFLEPYPSSANFILCRLIGRDAARLARDLAAQGIFLRHFDQAGLRDHIRISVGKPEHSRALLAALSRME